MVESVELVELFNEKIYNTFNLNLLLFFIDAVIPLTEPIIIQKQSKS
jgi:hypothetical protein